MRIFLLVQVEKTDAKSAVETPKESIPIHVESVVETSPQKIEKVEENVVEEKKVLEDEGSMHRSPSLGALAEDPETTNKVQQAYAFAGMHHIFDEHNRPVTNLLFAHNDKNLLAFSSMDGKISICHGLYNPKRIRTLQHDESVTDFAWSRLNDMIISTSTDKTIRIWQVRNGECIRTIQDDSPTTCCCFHPVNDDIIVVGNGKGVLKIYSLSSGKLVRKETLEKTEMLLNVTGQLNINKLTGLTYTNTIVTSLTFNGNGSILFVADNKGSVRTFMFNDKLFNLSLVGKTLVSKGKPVSSVRFKEWGLGSETHDSLIVNACDSTVKLYWIQKTPTTNSQIVLERSFPIKNKREAIRGNFCPIRANRDGACIVSGSENGTIFIFDVTRAQPCVNELQGHAGIVYDVCWNSDETLLASCDSTGTVILWKRILNVDGKRDE